MTIASLPQHQDLFLEPRFTVDLTTPDEDEDFDAAYEALPAPTTSAREQERPNRRPRRR
ncbi:hypothetical protein [Streptomyces durocortorensis]|uniref:Uncharacterized protein n=1 Tax=Streptomyces durocortorensis TaxID=2811104 RepID=A0ABS2HQT8_9ACTN|nr:hypothetical protein [Streptomyces durocortorensis]MBM7052693.1 hypothetical protein [Streptomyces durocortorensis]